LLEFLDESKRSLLRIIEKEAEPSNKQEEKLTKKLQKIKE
jgi:succinate dehydrogenase flavin-adding protein (antitoxin of CptAB toxin-antitoxin module)